MVKSSLWVLQDIRLKFGSLFFPFQGIQVTATSPTASAVRFETGVVELEFSNRPQQQTAGLEGEEECKFNNLPLQALNPI